MASILPSACHNNSSLSAPVRASRFDDAEALAPVSRVTKQNNPIVVSLCNIGNDYLLGPIKDAESLGQAFVHGVVVLAKLYGSIRIGDVLRGRRCVPFDYSSLSDDPGIAMSWLEDRWYIDILRTWNSVYTSEKYGGEDG